MNIQPGYFGYLDICGNLDVFFFCVSLAVLCFVFVHITLQLLIKKN